jgi:hypothetical protein
MAMAVMTVMVFHAQPLPQLMQLVVDVVVTDRASTLVHKADHLVSNWVRSQHASLIKRQML